MGFLIDNGETYNFEESKQYQQKIKEAGVIQFLKLLKKNQHKNQQIKGCNLIWGDEIEFMLINLNDQQRIARLQLNSKEIFNKFHSYPEEMKQDNQGQNFEAKYEYGSWMIETTPDSPFSTINNIHQLVQNFQKRRNEISSIIDSQDKLLYLSVFPMLGVRDYYTESKQICTSLESINEEEDQYKCFIIPPIFETVDDYYYQQLQIEKQNTEESLKKYSGESFNEVNNPFSCSLFTDDKIITSHQRFYTLTQNIRQRRGEKVNIQMPLFIDKNTSCTPTEILDPYPNQIYMDSMSFGMGNSCLQLTMAAKDLTHARFLYDQLSIISPLFLALSAASPIFKGKLSDVDTRWDAICQSVDDRNEEERKSGKSRYASISYYIGKGDSFKQEYNDVKTKLNTDIMQFAQKQGESMGIDLDDNLLQHLGFLFSRDALVIFKSKVDNIDEFSTEHFENLQSTNWNSVRFKPPPSLDSDLPWRVEFRTMDLQINDEENAMLVYLVLAIALMFYTPEFNLNFYVPISVVDKNFLRASKRNALLSEKFYFRKNILDDKQPEIIELYLKDFFFGNSEFIGIQQLLFNFLQKFLPEENTLLKQYQFIFNFLRDRVEGKKLNTASWMRQFVLSHPDYKQDSIISENIAYDLLNNFELRQSKKIIDDNFLNWIPKF